MTELAFVAAWCASIGGVAEVVLDDRTRVDCLTEQYAWEVDRGENWAEAGMQALHYARMTGRLPAVLLLQPTPAQVKRLEDNIWFWQLPVEIREYYGE